MNRRNRQISAIVTVQRARTRFKGGVQAYRLGIDFLSSQRSSGIFNFNGQYTGNPFADFLLGYGVVVEPVEVRDAELPFALHALLRPGRLARDAQRLTLNLGLRYELNPPPVDVNDAIANFDLDTDPANPRIVLAGCRRDDRAARALQGTNYKQFAPRAGFAYSLPGDKTVVRGGVGIFYAKLITLGGMQSLEINPPNHVRINQSTDRDDRRSIFLSQGFADRRAVAGERAQRHAGLLRSQQQAARRRTSGT